MHRGQALAFTAAGLPLTRASSAAGMFARSITTKDLVRARVAQREKEFNAKLCFADFAMQSELKK